MPTKGQKVRPTGLSPDPISVSLLDTVLGSLDVVVYAADPDTYEMLYMNDACQRVFGNGVGSPCYRVLQNRSRPCPFCSNDEIFGPNLGKTHTWEFQNEVTGHWYHCVDRAVVWEDGRNVRLEIASEISRLKEAEQELEHQVEEDTAQLRSFEEALQKELTAREQAEVLLAESRRQLRIRQTELRKKKSALQEVIGAVEIEKKRLKEDVLHNADSIIGHVEKMTARDTSVEHLDLLRRELKDLTSSLGSNLAHLEHRFSPREREVCEMVYHGCTSKEIAALLGVSLGTVHAHRRKIRRKLGITKKKVNLQAFLEPMDG